MYNEKGELEVAEKLYNVCLVIYYELYGVDCIRTDVAGVLLDLTGLLMSQGKLDIAEEMLSKCRVMLYALFGINGVHPLIASELSKRGCLLLK